jgi:hypothetical protein
MDILAGLGIGVLGVLVILFPLLWIEQRRKYMKWIRGLEVEITKERARSRQLHASLIESGISFDLLMRRTKDLDGLGKYLDKWRVSSHEPMFRFAMPEPIAVSAHLNPFIEERPPPVDIKEVEWQDLALRCRFAVLMSGSWLLERRVPATIACHYILAEYWAYFMSEDEKNPFRNLPLAPAPTEEQLRRHAPFLAQPKEPTP